MEVLAKKWHPGQPECVFQHYFYVDVGDKAPWYGPGEGEDARKWEEALEKKPNEGCIPVLARGFGAQGIGQRIIYQSDCINALNVRVHEINESLKLRMEEHELKFSIRTQEARRKHIAVSRRCLALATRVQVLRNRGYALDSAEEELKNKLGKLEKTTFDPVLSGRQEEIWARMTVVRERAQMLKDETEKLGKQAGSVEQAPIDEGNMLRVKKASLPPSHLKQETHSSNPPLTNSQLLEDYDSQLAHLSKELEIIKKDFADWEAATKPSANGTSSGR